MAKRHPFEGLQAVLPYVAETGTAAYSAICAFVAVAVALEFLSPGFAANSVAPQSLALAAVVAGALSVAAETPRRKRTWRSLAYAAAALAAAAFAFWAAWFYFGAVPDVRARLAAAIVATVLISFFAYRTSPDDL